MAEEKNGKKKWEAECAPEEFPLSSKDKEGGESPDEEIDGFDAALNLAGSWGPWQVKAILVTCYAMLFVSQHSVAAAYLSAIPDHWCDLPGFFNSTYVSKEYEAIKNYSIPWEGEQFSKCEIYSHAINDDGYYTEDGTLQYDTLSSDTVECQEWDFDQSIYLSTVVSEWSLVCHDRWLAATVQATYMGGLLVGSLVMGQVADRYGRRPTTLFSACGLIITGIVCSFSPNFSIFLILRFLIALFGAGVMVTNFVLTMELMKAYHRTSVGMLYGILFGTGIAILPCIAYFVRSWRSLQLIIGLCSITLVAYYWLLPESPRWLASKGRYAESIKLLKVIAKGNNKKLPDDDELLTLMRSGKKSPEELSGSEPSGPCSALTEMLQAQAILVRTPIMRRRSLISFFIWMVAAMVYYGLIFSGGNINADPYLMVFVSGAIEIPAFLICILMLKKFGRRMTAVPLFVVCGISCLLILTVPKRMVYVNLVLVNFGKFATAAVFQLCFLYTSELFPTGVRNIAVGTSSMFGRVGSSLAPFIVDLLGEVHYTVPSTVFGVLSLIAAGLCLLLPETANRKLPDTVEEVEAMSR